MATPAHGCCLVRAGRRRLEPSWRVAPGECRDSLALEVAASCRLPEAILQRASQHYQVRALPVLMRLSPCLSWCSSRLAGPESTRDA